METKSSGAQTKPQFRSPGMVPGTSTSKNEF